MKKQWLWTGLIILVALVGVGLYVQSNTTGSHAEPVTQVQDESSNNVEREELESMNKAQYDAYKDYNTGTDTYVNDQYGFKFKYDSKVSRVVVKGNRVETLLQDLESGEEGASGPYIEFFSKNTNTSFADAIRETILARYPSPYCKVALSNSNGLLKEKGFQEAYVIDHDPKGSELPSQTVGNCGYEYVASNSPGEYFFYDPSHPNVFFYYSSGQSPFHLIETFTF